MAKKYSGEISLTTETRRITLRLDIASTQELEGYFKLSILDILLEKFNARAPLTDELLIVYAAITGRDINDGEALVEACTEMSDEVGIAASLVGVKQCLWATIISNADDLPGKPQAVQTVRHPLNRKESNWTQHLLQRM